MSRFEVFTKFPLFEGIGIDELLPLLGKVSLDFEKYQKGDRIPNAEESSTGLLLLMEGTVKKGDELIQAPSTLLYRHVFGHKQTDSQAMTAESQCNTLCINKTSLIDLLMSSETVLENYLSMLSDSID